MNTSRTVLTVALAAALLHAPTAAAVPTNYPIDDFEILPFDVTRQGPGGTVDTLIVPPPLSGHIISQSRKVQCGIGGEGTPNEVTRAWLSPGDAVNDEMTASISAHGDVYLFYEIGYPADLTVGGTVDRIELDGTASMGAGLVHVTVRDSSSTLDASSGHQLTSSTTILFSEFANADLQHITKISLVFFDEGTYTVREIRLRGTTSNDLKYTVLDEATFTPPLPSPPMRVQFWDRTFSQALYQLDLGITEADAGFLPDLSMNWQWASAFDGWTGGTSLMWTDGAPFEPTQFSFSFDLSAAEGCSRTCTRRTRSTVRRG
ncbi:hypothetical protein K8I85_12550 [bacterium]|nr:hypothetical protein [bacterium]